MVEQHWNKESGTGHCSLVPNRSLSWRANKRLWCLLSVVMLTISLGLASLGLWLVLPYSALAMLALGVGLYVTGLRLCRREVVLLTEDEVIVQRGRRRAEQEIHLPRCWTQLVIHPGRSPSDAPRIALRSYGRETELGVDLNADERGECAAALRAAIARQSWGNE